MIKEAFVSFEIAKLLKEKGFNEPCIATYNSTTKKFHVEELYLDWSTQWESYISVPTHQMTMAWLREVYNIFIIIEPYSNTSCYFSLWEDDNYYENPLRKSFPSYEETVEQALKYVLEKIK